MSLSRLNDLALDSYLRGEHGELMRREALQVYQDRGKRSRVKTEEDMVEYLKERGWVVFKPRR